MRGQRTVGYLARGSASNTATSYMSSTPLMMNGGRPAVSHHRVTVMKWVSSPARDGKQ